MVAITQVLVAGLMTIAVQALPQPQAAASSATTAAPPAATQDPKAIAMQLFGKLFTAPTAVKRFQTLLTKDAKGETLLTGDELKKQIVFPFTPKANTSTAKGGVAVAAVRYYCTQFTFSVANMVNRTLRASLSSLILGFQLHWASWNHVASTLLTCTQGPPSS
jgi:hypothetical protein